MCLGMYIYLITLNEHVESTLTCTCKYMDNPVYTNICIHVCLLKHSCYMYACEFVCTHAWMRKGMHVFMYLCVFECKNLVMKASVYLHTNMQVNTHSRVSPCISISISIYTYTYTGMYPRHMYKYLHKHPYICIYIYNTLHHGFTYMHFLLHARRSIQRMCSQPSDAYSACSTHTACHHTHVPHA